MANAPRELDISEIASEVATKGLREEANANKTFRGGSYNIRYQGHKVQENDKGERSISFNVSVLNRETGNRVGSAFFDAAWEARYNEFASGRRLARASQLYGQLLKALDLEDGTGPKAVIDAFTQKMAGAFFTETLRSPEGKYIDIAPERKETNGEVRAVTLQESQGLVDSGYSVKNYVQAVGKAK